MTTSTLHCRLDDDDALVCHHCDAAVSIDDVVPVALPLDLCQAFGDESIATCGEAACVARAWYQVANMCTVEARRARVAQALTTVAANEDEPGIV